MNIHLPRRTAVALFRLETGHDCLGEHLQWMGIVSGSCCSLCGEDIVSNKVHLLHCRRLDTGEKDQKDLTGLYWEAQGLMMWHQTPAIWKQQHNRHGYLNTTEKYLRNTVYDNYFNLLIWTKFINTSWLVSTWEPSSELLWSLCFHPSGGCCGKSCVIKRYDKYRLMHSELSESVLEILDRLSIFWKLSVLTCTDRMCKQFVL